MSNDCFNTPFLRDRVQRWQNGSLSAANDLLWATTGRLEMLARRMLRNYPRVRAWADACDIVSGAAMRLLNALRTIQPASTRGYFTLSALQIRRELLTLTRRFSTYHLAQPDGLDEIPAQPAGSDADLARWARFHEAVERLPADLREVVSLTFYHGWTQPRIADLFGVDEQTVRRRWLAACERLRDQLGELPPLEGEIEI